jgi:hypothetical protein
MRAARSGNLMRGAWVEEGVRISPKLLRDPGKPVGARRGGRAARRSLGDASGISW